MTLVVSDWFSESRSIDVRLDVLPFPSATCREKSCIILRNLLVFREARVIANWVASGLLLCEYRYDATHAAKQKNVRILRRIQPSKLDITNISLAEKLP